MRIPSLVSGLFLVPAVALAMTGCPGTLEDPERFSCGNAVLVQRCATSSCHDADAPAAGLNLVPEGLAGRIVGVPGSTMADDTTGAIGCGGRILADPANPEESLIYLKVTDPPCGAAMPIGTPLDAEQKQCLLELIQDL